MGVRLTAQGMQVQYLVGELRCYMPHSNWAHAATTEPAPQQENQQKLFFIVHRQSIWGGAPNSMEQTATDQKYKATLPNFMNMGPKKGIIRERAQLQTSNSLKISLKSISNNLLISIMRSGVREGVRKRWKIGHWKNCSIALSGGGGEFKENVCLSSINV